jgi:flavin reductase (DIM6/NTAB) family NADH-FMN oxidoreductase RutF
VNESEKKAALTMIPYGLYVVGVGDGSTAHAFTANWLSQCSFRPPLVMVGVKKDGRAHAILERGGAFAVNILASGQKELAAYFFRGPEGADGRFGPYAFERGETGAPLLIDAPASLDCRVVHLFRHGDHSVVVGEVVDARLRREARALTMDETGWKYAG